MTVLNCFDYPDFRLRGRQNRQSRNTAYFHVIGNGGDMFCVSNAHCIERYFGGLTAIFRHTLIICYLNARVR
jgi:hypothetical protein